MLESIQLFSEVANSNHFEKNGLILFLNKMDLFDVKIKLVDLKVCFAAYEGGLDYDKAVGFIRKRFQEKVAEGRKLFIHETCAIHRENIELVIHSVQQTILGELTDQIVL